MKAKSLAQFIKDNRQEIDAVIRKALGGELPHKNDRERRLWVLNDEGLYF